MRLIRLKEVMNLTGLGRSSIYNFMAEECFPQSISLGERAIAWHEEEIEQWIVTKIENRNTAITNKPKLVTQNTITEKDVTNFITNKFKQCGLSDAIAWLMQVLS